MRNYLASVLLFGAILTTSAAAQDVPPATPIDKLDAAVTYAPMRANDIASNGFWMQGGSAQFHALLWRNIGVVADVATSHAGAINSSPVGLDILTTTFGPRYTWSPKNRRFSIYGHVLAGAAFGRNSVFPGPFGANSSSHSLALQAGGGLNIPLNRFILVRVVEADWVRTQLPNSTTNAQNNLRLGTGLVFRFK